MISCFSARVFSPHPYWFLHAAEANEDEDSLNALYTPNKGHPGRLGKAGGGHLFILKHFTFEILKRFAFEIVKPFHL